LTLDIGYLLFVELSVRSLGASGYETVSCGVGPILFLGTVEEVVLSIIERVVVEMTTDFSFWPFTKKRLKD
jgi:hypothetical protein